MRFSVGYELTEPVRQAILQILKDAWVPALDQDGTVRDNGEVAEITDTVESVRMGCSDGAVAELSVAAPARAADRCPDPLASS